MTANWRKLGIIAGGGALPQRIIDSCQERSSAFFVIRLSGWAEPALAAYPGENCGVGEIGKMFRALKQEECDAVVFAGSIKRPNFKDIKPDLRGAALMSKVIAAATKGDGALLGVMVDAVEAEGFKVLGAEETMAGLEAPVGVLGSVTPDTEDLRDIRKAASVIDALGPFDVGQAAVVSKGLVVAIEAAEGTQGVLQRCADLPETIKGGARAGVLVKRPKPEQEMRIDLPVIGPETIRQACEAGLCGIAVEAGRALIIDQEVVAEQADAAGLFVYGFTDADLKAL